jgi:hypothetical protein
VEPVLEPTPEAAATSEKGEEAEALIAKEQEKAQSIGVRRRRRSFSTVAGLCLPLWRFSFIIIIIVRQPRWVVRQRA